MTRKYTRWTKALLEPIVMNSKSYAECLKRMGLVCTGGNYKNLQRNITLFQIDSSHMTHQAHNSGMEFKLFDELSKSSSIKTRLLKELGNVCQMCGNDEWLGHPIPLELEHIDGNNRNHHRKNVTLLCCNCHALTPTWRNRKRR